MTKQWKQFQRVLLANMCKILRYTVTWKMSNNEYWYGSDNRDLRLDPNWTRMDEISWDGATREPVAIRVDAVTAPSYPTVALYKLLQCIVPTCGRTEPSSCFANPKEGLDGLSLAWHEAVAPITFSEPTVYDPCKELRVNWGQKTFDEDMAQHGANDQALECYSYGPNMCVSPNIVMVDGEHPDKAMWMNRAVLEMLPTKLYHRIIWVDGRGSSAGDIWEDTVVACLSNGGTGAFRLYDCETSVLPMCAAADRQYGLCAGIGRTIRCLAFKPDYARVNNFNPLSSYTGPCSIPELRLQPVIFRWREWIARDRRTVEGLKITGVPVKRELVDQHENDAMWECLKTALAEEW